MGRGWIMGFKMEQAAKRGLVFTKLSKEIAVAARLGGPDPEHNARLRGAIEDARKASMPRDNIERAIKKGSGQIEGVHYEDIMYEGHAPHGVGVLIEVVTDNRNRTVSEIRTIFKHHNGHLGEANSVAWMFSKVGLVEATHPKMPEDIEAEAIEVNAENVVKHDDVVSFITAPGDLDSVRTALMGRGWTIQKAELSYEAKNNSELDGPAREEALKFLAELNDHEDVRRVHATLA